ncbi:MAG: response regulator [Candidatus Omnitrophica bacterium]|nr:response regulator [Candidatus Omnitrophota bacterium]
MQKILVVDDEPGIREILYRFLTKSGYEVLKASCGAEALKIIDSGEKIDFMVIDMKMPEMKGIDVLREFSKRGKILPFIILSGSLELEEYVEVIKGLGFDNFEIGSKPIDLFELLKIVQKRMLNAQGLPEV